MHFRKKGGRASFRGYHTGLATSTVLVEVMNLMIVLYFERRQGRAAPSVSVKRGGTPEEV